MGACARGVCVHNTCTCACAVSTGAPTERADWCVGWSGGASGANASAGTRTEFGPDGHEHANVGCEVVEVGRRVALHAEVRLGRLAVALAAALAAARLNERLLHLDALEGRALALSVETRRMR
eukprot:942755-Pleurochrysis_carterae.AAC.2